MLRKPNRYQTRIQFLSQWMTSKLLHGNTYVYLQRNGAGVVEADLPLQAKYEKKVRNYAKDMFGFQQARYFNMGVTVWSANILPHLNGQTPKEFIERPEFEKFVNGEGRYRWSTDQILLNTWVNDMTAMKTRCLDWRWNCMYDYVRPEALKQNPYFVHFALAANMPRKGAEIPEIIAGLQ